MIIKEVVLKNFKMHKDLTVKLGKTTLISGGNGVGKSTIYDAVQFCFFGEDLAGHSSAEHFKPIIDKVQITGVNTSIKVVTDVGSFTRGFKETYTTKDGEIERTLTGHKGFFKINNVECNKSKFEMKINSLIGDMDSFSYISNPQIFLNDKKNPWKKRRAYLLGDAGNLNELEDNLAEIKSGIKSIDKSLVELPIRIDEVYKGIIEVDSSKEDVEKESDVIKSNITTLKEKIANLNSKSSTLTLKEELLNKKSTLSELESEARIKYEENLKIATANLGSARDEFGELENIHNKKFKDQNQEYQSSLFALHLDKNELGKDIAILMDRKLEAESIIESFREQWLKEDKKGFMQDDKCHACGQDLPDELLEANMKSFKLQKANTKKEIEESADKAKADLAEILESISEMQKSLVTCNTKIKETVKLKNELEKDYIDNIYRNPKLEATIKVLSEEVDNLSLETSPKQTTLEGEIAKLEMDLLKENSSSTTETLEKEVKRLEFDLEKVYETLAIFEQNEKKNELIEEYRKQMLGKKKEIAKLKKQKLEAETAIGNEIGRVEGNVNKNFEKINFEFFKKKLNGNTESVCILKMDGIPYEILNTASQMNACVDLARGLSKMANKEYPIWVDRMESVQDLIPVDTQMIQIEVNKNKNGKINPLKVEVIDE